jgi:hypothetical protein
MKYKSHKEYLRDYRKHRVHRVIIFNQDDYDMLLAVAKKYHKPFSTLVREFALAQANNQYLLPSEEQTKSVQYLLKKIGTNINQLAHVANATLELPHSGIQFMQKEFIKLENDIKNIYHKPIIIEDIIHYAISTNPAYVKRIENILKEFSK